MSGTSPPMRDLNLCSIAVVHFVRRIQMFLGKKSLVQRTQDRSRRGNIEKNGLGPEMLAALRVVGDNSYKTQVNRATVLSRNHVRVVYNRCGSYSQV